MTEKEFGRFSRNELKALVTQIHELPRIRTDWIRALRSHTDQVGSILTPPFFWAKIYAEPFTDLVGVAITLMGLDQDFQLAAQSDNPQQTLLARLADESPPEAAAPPRGLPIPEGDKGKYIIGSWFAVTRSIQAIWYYGLPINNLVTKAAQGDDASLMKAVRADRSAVACPPIADRIAFAELCSDQQFFKQLRAANNGLPRKPRDEYGPLRYVLWLLEDEGALQNLTRPQRCELLCEELGLYPYGNNDAEKSLDQFIRRWRKSRPT